MRSADLITQVAQGAPGPLTSRRLPPPHLAEGGALPAAEAEEAVHAAAAAARAHLRHQQRHARRMQQLPMPPSRSSSPTSTSPTPSAGHAAPPTTDKSSSPATIVPPLESGPSSDAAPPPGSASATNPPLHPSAAVPLLKSEGSNCAVDSPPQAPQRAHTRKSRVPSKKAGPLRRLLKLFICASSETEEMAYTGQSGSRSTSGEKRTRRRASPKISNARLSSSSPEALPRPLPREKEPRMSTSCTRPASPSTSRDLSASSPVEEKSILPDLACSAAAADATASGSSAISVCDNPAIHQTDSGTPATEATRSAQAGEYTLRAPSMQHKPSTESRWTRDSRHSSVYPPAVGGTKLPRDETEDVLSGAVVPPGSSLPPPTPTKERNAFISSSSSTDLLAASAATENVEEEVTSTERSHGQHAVIGLGVEGFDELAPASDVGVANAPAADADEDGGDGEADAEQAFCDEQWLQWELEEEQRLIMQGGAGVPHDEHGRPMPLLPKVHPHDRGRKCLVLDLDETLVHSSFKLLPQADFIVPVEIEDEIHHVYVAKRPGVDEFLHRMGEVYEIVVFTASLSKYADPVLDLLDLHQVVRHRLFREHCLAHRGTYVKDLSMLGREVRDVIILDNSPASYLFHATNAVPVSSWFSDPHDTELLDMCAFLQDLGVVEDVRAVLDGAL